MLFNVNIIRLLQIKNTCIDTVNLRRLLDPLYGSIQIYSMHSKRKSFFFPCVMFVSFYLGTGWLYTIKSTLRLLFVNV